MADQKIAPLTDLSKVNPYGLPEDQLNDLQDTLQDQIKSLETRYAQPNWWKVAAGFAKPQLGGFLASLGSASEAMGENVEQQRAMALPLAQMRTQLAQSQILMGQNKSVSDEIKTWYTNHPNEKPTPTQIADWAARAPDAPAVKSLLSQQEFTQKQQGVDVQKLQVLKDLAHEAQNTGININTLLAQAGFGPEYADAAKKAIAPPTVTPAPGTPNAAPSSNAIERAKGDLAAIDREVADTNKNISNYTPDQIKQRLAILNAEKAKAQAIIGGQGAAAPVESEGYYPSTFSAPSGIPVAGQQEISKENAKANAAKVEAPLEAEWKTIAPFHRNSTNYSSAISNADAALDAAHSHPEVFAAVTNLVRNAGPLAAAGSAGIGVHLGPYGAKIDLPAEAYLKANIPPDQQAYADMVMNQIATTAYYALLARGISPESAGAEKFGQILLQETHMGQHPAAIEQSLRSNKELFNHHADLYEIVSKERKKVDPNSLTPLADIYHNSKELDSYNRRYREIQKQLAKSSISNVLTPKKP